MKKSETKSLAVPTKSTAHFKINGNYLSLTLKAFLTVEQFKSQLAAGGINPDDGRLLCTYEI